jgi:hypothetical protein
MKWREGATWSEVYDNWPDEAESKVRSAARDWKDKHPDEFPTAETPFDEHPEGLGAQFDEEGNVGTGSSLSTDIKTPEEQMEAAGIDPAVWTYDDFKLRTYYGWRGDTRKDLVFDEGKISGYIKDGGIIKEPLYSLFVEYYRIEPEPLEPTFSLIQCPVDYPDPPKAAGGNQVKALLFSDAQIGFEKDTKNGKLTPFHDRLMLDVIAQVAWDYQPNFIGVLGDMADLTRFTRRYAHKPEFFWSTQPALYELYWYLRRLRELCPDARIVYVEGNHEVRLPCYVRDHMIEMYGMKRVSGRFPTLSMPDLLDMDALKIEWIDGYEEDKATFRPVRWMVWEHGNIARTTGNTAKAIVEKAVRWRFSGHTHRCEVASRSFEENESDERPPVSSVQFGCCCHTDGRVPGSSPGCQWQKRFGIVEFDKRDPPPTVEVIPVRKGRALWRGKRYEGRDYADELRHAWPDWNW